MEAIEKAEELVEKYAPIMPNEDWKEKAKQCALIAVDEIISELKIRKGSVEYYEEVKQEIEKL